MGVTTSKFNLKVQLNNTIAVEDSVPTSESLPCLLDSAFRWLVQRRQYTCVHDYRNAGVELYKIFYLFAMHQ